MVLHFMAMTAISTARLSEMNYKKKYREFCRFLLWGKLDTCQHFLMNFDDVGRHSIQSVLGSILYIHG